MRFPWKNYANAFWVFQPRTASWIIIIITFNFLHNHQNCNADKGNNRISVASFSRLFLFIVGKSRKVFH
jgi:hypothetical protein